MNLILSTVAMTLGLFMALSPHQAAKIWGSEQLEKLAPGYRAAFLLGYRVFGIALCLGGVLSALDDLLFVNP